MVYTCPNISRFFTCSVIKMHHVEHFISSAATQELYDLISVLFYRMVESTLTVRSIWSEGQLFLDNKK